jgi:ribosomal protection tetracycline resistance protein
LSAENPLLGTVLFGGQAEINITGTIQLEVLDTLLRERFGLAVTFAPPTVIYRETPASIAEGFEAYTMPKPCWAVIRFLIEPLPRGSGVEYVCAISNEKIHYRYQGQISQTLPVALAQGPLGWEVTDLRITLIDGGDHPIHTHPLDFVLATPLAMMDGLVRAGTTLLEPMLRVRISAPEAYAGRIAGDFAKMRGQFDAPVILNGTFTLEGRVPVATSLDYPVRLASLTGGQAVLSTRFDGYDPCPLEQGATAEHRGVDPRDRAKYILWKRSALKG